MKEYFLRSSNLVNQHVWLVILAGLLNVSILNDSIIYITVIGHIVGFFLVIIICVRISLKIEIKEDQSFFQIVKDNWKNYLIALIVLSIPIFSINHIITLLPFATDQLILLKESEKGIVRAISIYVMPIVFLKSIGFMAVISGITYFIQNIKQSMLILPFVVSMFILSAGGGLWLIEEVKGGAEIFDALPVLVALNIVAVYLSFIVYAAATLVLVENQSSSSKGAYA